MKSESAVKADVQPPVTMEAESEEPRVAPTLDAAAVAHRTFALEDRHWRIVWSLLQAAAAWEEVIPTPTRVMLAAMPVVKAIAPLDKEETEQRKILVVPVARHGLVLVTTEMAVASALAAMVPLTLATTSVLAAAVEVATTAVAEVEVIASLRARLAAAAAVADQA